MSKIYLLTIIETLGRGGAEQVLVNTLPELQKLGVVCEVAILFDRDDLAGALEREGVVVHRLGLSYKWNIVEGIYKLNKLIRMNRYDIVHAHLFFAYFYAGIVKVLNPEVKTLTTFHNLGYNTYPADAMIKKLRKRLDAFVVNNLIDNRVAVSGAVQEHFKKELDVLQVDLMPNSFPLERMSQTEDLDKNKVLSTYVDLQKYHSFSITPGRLVKEKGHSFLLKALARLDMKSMKHCHFIVGAGPLEKKIKEQITKEKLHNVVLISGLPQQELFKLISACDFVVIPSIFEGFGMIIGESMALEKTVIASNISGIPDLIENEKEGLLVPARDSEALAEAIKRLYENEALRSTLAINAKEKIKRFDTKIIAKQWIEYYEDMLNG